ncbi:alpha-amylase family protein [Amycolatopsis sp. CA-128772]|uniref:alpha-amylase family protein n=1 Tax=Amycolatopsis sp. CA-128772 TaxID=2073159 RepID=UPI000CD05BAA|nr:alpha-amylase family protein [Amycolatopsis sp. CA-128772]
MDRWYRNGVIYSLDIETFQDSDDDGVGDLCGLTERLDYLGRLGVDTIWLNPCHPSPRRDGGYDITDYYGIDPRFGTLGDFAELVSQADEAGIRIVLDLVVNHTSDEHPWFRSALSGREAPYHDWYVWADHEPADRWDGCVFPGSEEETWSYAESVGRWYRHRFYRFQPELDVEHPEVAAELAKIVTFWLRLGVAGFRIDAAPFLIESHGRRDFSLLRRLRETASWQRGDAILLAEANVPEDELLEYFGTADDEASRATMLFDFRLNQALMLGLARGDAEPVRERLRHSPRLPGQAQWATFLRNHDEVDLGGLSPAERGDVIGRFGPEPHMQLYDRGIRRRLACMLDGDRRRLELAYSLLLTMPGSPVLRYGDEIGMGEDLALPERTAIRTPMQWSDGTNGGFSGAPAGQLVAPLVQGGPFGYERVNVLGQRRDANSLLTWFERVLHTRKECPEIAVGRHEPVDGGPPEVLVHRAETAKGRMVFVHNLGPTACRVRIPAEADDIALAVFEDSGYDDRIDPADVAIAGHGYRWFRLVTA